MRSRYPHLFEASASFLQLDLPASEDILLTVSNSEDFSQDLVSHEEPGGSTHAEPTTSHHDVDVESAPHVDETNEPAMSNPDAEVAGDISINVDSEFRVQEQLENIVTSDVHDDHTQLEDIAAPDEIHPVESSSNVLGRQSLRVKQPPIWTSTSASTTTKF